MANGRQRILQSQLIVWLDDVENRSENLFDVEFFRNVDECRKFIDEMENEKIFVVFSSSFGENFVQRIHSLNQIEEICVFHHDRSIVELNWTKNWPKIRHVENRIDEIHSKLQTAMKQSTRDNTPMSIVESTRNFDRLDPSFMYTQLFKRILLKIQHRRDARANFVEFCREIFSKKRDALKQLDEFQRDYRSNRAIWWYTKETFLYQMLNRSLRLFEADVIVTMGFFIDDLHQQIQTLYNEQIENYGGKSFTVYRGQRLSINDLEKLKKSRDGLISFNSFLSTTKNRTISFSFAPLSTTDDKTMIAVVFQMKIDPKIKSTPFADLNRTSSIRNEDEILFSMNSVFRIGEVTNLNKNDKLWQIDLTLTSDDDEDLRLLTNEIEKEVQGGTGWQSLGKLLIQVGQVDKAEELYRTLLKQKATTREKAIYYHQLGCIKDQQANYPKALAFYERALTLKKEIFAENDPELATSYNNIGLVYSKMAEPSKALSFYDKALAIRQTTLSADHPHLAASFNSIATTHENLGDFKNALSFYDKALTIQQKSLSENHPDLAVSLNNIGLVHMKLGDFRRALNFYEKAFAIRQKSLPSNHPLIAASLNSLGSAHENLGDLRKALKFYENAVEIQQKILPENHPNLGTSYACLGNCFYKLNDFEKALKFHEKTFEIQKKILPKTHPDLATSLNNLACCYLSLKNYQKALTFFQQTLDILQSFLPTTNSRVENVSKNIEMLKKIVSLRSETSAIENERNKT